MAERYRFWYFRHYPFFDRLFSRGCRDCRVVDRPGIREWAASDPGGRRDRTGKFHFRCTRVYWHFCHCRCYPGAAGKECSQADESQVLDSSEKRCIGSLVPSADHLVLRLVASSFTACGYASAEQGFSNYGGNTPVQVACSQRVSKKAR